MFGVSAILIMLAGQCRIQISSQSVSETSNLILDDYFRYSCISKDSEAQVIILKMMVLDKLLC